MADRRLAVNRIYRLRSDSINKLKPLHRFASTGPSVGPTVTASRRRGNDAVPDGRHEWLSTRIGIATTFGGRIAARRSRGGRNAYRVSALGGAHETAVD
jgi:hypothetical protein